LPLLAGHCNPIEAGKSLKARKKDAVSCSMSKIRLGKNARIPLYLC